MRRFLHSTHSRSGTRLGPFRADTARSLALPVAVLVVVSIAVMWVQVFYRGEHPNIIMSFLAADKPWMPAHTTAQSVIGKHYFGDFQLPLAWASNVRHGISPYLSSKTPANYPPFAFVFLLPFTFLSLKVAFGVYFGLTALSLLVPVYLLLDVLDAKTRLALAITIAGTSAGVLTTLDRGNVIGIAFGLFLCAVAADRAGHRRIAAVFFIVAIALRTYLALYLVLLLAYRRYRDFFACTASVILVELVSMFAVAGALRSNLITGIPANFSQKLETGSQLVSMSAYSLVPKIVRLAGVHPSKAILAPPRLTLWITSGIVFAAIFLVVFLDRVPRAVSAVLACSCIELVVPFSPPYTLVWVILGCIFLLRPDTNNRERVKGPLESAFLALAIGAVVTTFVPSTIPLWSAGFRPITLTHALSPLLLVLLLALSLVASFTKPRRPAIAAPD